MSSTWLWIILGNVAAFANAFRCAMKRDFDKQRERFMEYVRKWDPDMCDDGYVIAEVEVTPHFRRYGEGRAVWRNSEGETRTGRAEV
jgi:hypothetical protein